MHELSSSSSSKEIKITSCRIFCIVFSISTHIWDVGSDIWVASEHFRNENILYFQLTIFFIVLPGIVMATMNVWWYLRDKTPEIFKACSTQWTIRIVCSVFLMAPLARNFEALYYAKKSRNAEGQEKKNYLKKVVYDSTDASFLRLIEAFLESAPQAVLQIYIISQAQCESQNHILSWTEIKQFVSITISLVSVGSSIPSYMRFLRESNDESKDLNRLNFSVLLLWQCLLLSARIITLGLFASIMLPFFPFLIFFHFFFAFVWIRGLNTNFCHNEFGEYVYNMILAVMFIFIMINPKQTKTSTRYVVYYTQYFIENIILITIWYCYCPITMTFRLPALIMVIMFLILGFTINGIYYMILHPSRGVPLKTSVATVSNYIKQFYPKTSTVA